MVCTYLRCFSRAAHHRLIDFELFCFGASSRHSQFFLHFTPFKFFCSDMVSHDSHDVTHDRRTTNVDKRTTIIQHHTHIVGLLLRVVRCSLFFV